MNQRETLFELIRRCCDEEATPEEMAQVEELLRDDADFRRNYLHYLNVDSGLATLPNRDIEPAPENRPGTLRFSQWRPLATATAAGIAIGLFCASVAWAIVSPDQRTARLIQPLLSESFENPTTRLIDHFPSQTGEWGGDRAQIVASPPGRSALHGDHVLSLATSDDSNLGYLQQIIDVSGLPLANEGEARTVEAIASYHSDKTGEQERYTLRLASFKESPGAIRKLWEGTTWREMDANTLTLSKAGLSTSADAEGWQTISAMVEVPADARSLVISLAAGRLDPAAPKTPHYLDDIRADLVISPRVKRLRPKRR